MQQEQTKFVNVRFPSELAEWLRRVAVAEDRTVSSYVRQLVRRHADETAAKRSKAEA